MNLNNRYPNTYDHKSAWKNTNNARENTFTYTLNKYHEKSLKIIVAYLYNYYEKSLHISTSINVENSCPGVLFKINY